MKFAIKVVWFFFATFSTISCNSQSLQLAEANKEYKESVSKFKKDFVEHFPREVESFPFTVLSSEDISYSHPRIWLKLSHSTEVLDTLINNLSLQAKAIFFADDTCLVVIDKHLTEDNEWDFDKKLRMGPEVKNIDLDCHESKLPVPKFYEGNYLETNTTSTGLTRDYKLYVLEAKSGVFMDEKKLPNGKYTPKDWKHGFSRGIAINEKTGNVVYWFDIW